MWVLIKYGRPAFAVFVSHGAVRLQADRFDYFWHPIEPAGRIQAVDTVFYPLRAHEQKAGTGRLIRWWIQSQLQRYSNDELVACALTTICR